jgi:N-acetylglucosamine malate deacetylase 1
VPRENVVLGQFETRRFPEFRQEILEYMIQLNRTFSRRSSLCTPRPISTRTTARSPKKRCAPFAATVLGYDVLRSSYGFFPNFLVEVTEKTWSAKSRAGEYQDLRPKYYFDPTITRSTMIRHGALANAPTPKGSISCGCRRLLAAAKA